MSGTPAVNHRGDALRLIGHRVGGRIEGGDGRRTSPVFCPATGRSTALLDHANQAVVTSAIDSAAGAQIDWAATPPHVRARVFFRFRELLERHTDDLAQLINAEHGKVIADARGEVQRGLEVVEFACAIPTLLKGDYSPSVGRNVDSLDMRQPLGVVAGVTPFNFPVMVPLWMFPVAIACGNSFVLKPSEKVPSAALMLAKLIQDAGLPDGVLSVVNGGAETVDALLDDPRIRAISFVGSTPVAQSVYARATTAGKRVQALGGAKNHMIILPDADLDQVVDALMGAAYGSAGERCMAISVAVPVGRALADALVARLAARVTALRIGPGIDSDDDMGPLVTAEHRDRVADYIDDGVREGATLVVDGRNLAPSPLSGFFIGGSLFDHVTPTMRVYREEIFGPVLSVVRAQTFDEAIALVNHHPFGNGVALMTRDGAAARTFMDRIEVGMVGVNISIPVPMAFHSFGGWKQSLFGDHHIHGMEGVRFYTRLKTSTVRWASPAFPGTDFAMPTLA